MKVFKFLFLALGVLFVVVAIAAFIFVKTFNVNTYLPQITKAASDALGREVSIAAAGLDFSWQVIAVDVFDIRVVDPDSGTAPRVEVDKVHARLELMPLLTRRKIEVSGIVVSGIKVSVDDPQMPLNIQITNLDARIRDFSLTDPFSVDMDCAFASRGNNIHVHTDVRLDQVEKKFTLADLTLRSDLARLDMNAIRAITPALAQAPLPEALAGQVTLKMPFLSAGAKAPADIKAEGNITLLDGRLEKWNILKSVLGRINVIPGLGEQIEALMSDKLRSKLGGDSTILDKMQAKFTVDAGQVFIDDGFVGSPLFEAKAKGTAGFDGTVSVEVSVYVAPDLSADLTDSIMLLKGLLDADKRIYVPGRVAGRWPGVSYTPDMGYLGRKIATDEGIQRIGDQLEKVLDKNPEVKEILNSVLNGIFKN